MQRNRQRAVGLAVAVVVLDTGGVPLWVSDAAAQLLAAGKGVRLSGGRLRTTDPRADVALRQAMSRAARTSGARRQGAAAGAPATITVCGRTGQPAFVVQVVALRGVEPTSTTRLVIAVFVHDLSRESAAGFDVLRALYALTPAEGRLAQLLGEGRSLREVAAELGVSGNTVRTHLKRLFEKTGAHSQAALVHLLLRGRAEES